MIRTSYPLEPRLIRFFMTSLVRFHVRGLPQPTVHAKTGRDIGFKRSSDGCAHSPSPDSSSGNPALLLGSGSDACPVLQRFGTCIAYLACLVPFGFRRQVCQ